MFTNTYVNTIFGLNIMEKNLKDLNDQVLLAARQTFSVIKEMLNAQTLPTGDAETTLAEIEGEIDRIDLEILGRGLLDVEELGGA